MYGGSLHNRMRFLLEIIQNIKQKCGTNFPVGVKLSTEDWEPDGITLDETIQVAKALEKAGCSHINLICGTHATSDREFLMPNEFNNKETKAIQDAVSIPCFAGHNIFTPIEAEDALEKGAGDFVALGRSLLADPMWAKKAQEGHPEDIVPCINCLVGCLDRGLLSNNVIHCAVNPSLYHFENDDHTKVKEAKKVAVVGAGPGGCEAALVAAQRGHKVTLYEKRALGGAMIEAAVPDNKRNINNLIKYYHHEIAHNKNISVIDETATVDKIKADNFDACVVAIGGKERNLKINGAKNGASIISAMDYLNGSQKANGQNIVVIGGGITGAETALELNKSGKNVTIVEVTDHFLSHQATSSSSRAYAYAISKTNIKVLTGLRPTSLTDKKLTLVDRFGNQKMIPADMLISAAGFIPQHEFYDRLTEETNMQVFNVGDSKYVRQIYDAIHEGYIAAKQL